MWYAALPPEEHPEDEENKQWLASIWQEPFGDRRQEIVLIGLQMDQTALTVAMDKCLLTDKEMKLGVTGWSKLKDPFEYWDLDEEEEASLSVSA